MKTIKYYSICLLIIIFCLKVNGKSYNFFSKVIIWGHPLHSHTHSYIHGGFYRAFSYLGYEVYWVSSLNDLKDIDLAGALFLTEGQVDANIPQRHDCYYIIHNWDSS